MTTPTDPKSTLPAPGDIRPFQFTAPAGIPTWGWPGTTWFNRVTMNRDSLSGDLGDPRSGGAFRWSLQEVVDGAADKELLFHYNPAVLTHIKAVAAAFLTKPPMLSESDLQRQRADEFENKARAAIDAEPLRGHWEVQLNVDISPESGGGNSRDAAAARWVQQRFYQDPFCFIAELVESPRSPWMLRLSQR